MRVRHMDCSTHNKYHSPLLFTSFRGKSLFDGKTLKGWDGNPIHWRWKTENRWYKYQGELTMEILFLFGRVGC